jgi:uncharacterized phage protein gp47/JayE
LPYLRPTLTELITQIQQDIIAAQITSPTIGLQLEGLLAQAVLLDVANAEAGLTYELYGYLDWISLQTNPYTATGEYAYAWGALKGIYPKDATAETDQFTVATGCVNGTDLPIGTLISRSDGVQFQTTADAVASGGAVTAPTIATVVGLNTIVVGDTAPMTIVTQITGIPSVGVGTVTTSGTNQELLSAFRTRMLLAYAAPPQGGDRADYVEWAEDVPGVTRAWVAPNLGGAGTVTVFTMFDFSEATYGGFPQGSNGVSQYDVGPDGVTPRDAVATGDQLTVANYICPLQPVTALVYSNAPTADPTNFTITSLGAANTSANQTAITAALNAMFLEYGNVGGTTNPVTNEAWPSIVPSDWFAAIASVAGVTSFAVPSPSAPIVPATGALPTLGTITFSA